MITLPPLIRSLTILSTHAVIWSSALALAYGFRFDFELPDIVDNIRNPLTILFFFLFRLIAFTYWNLDQISWRHVSTHDLVRVIKVHLSSTILLAAILVLAGIPNFPRSVIFMELVLSILGCATAKISVRMWFEASPLSRQKPTKEDREAIILGAGESGHLLVKTLMARREIPFHPIGILDDNPSMRGRNVFGVEVFGRLSDLEELLQANPKISAVILAIPTLSKTRIREIETICELVGVSLRRIQNFEDIALTSVDSENANAPAIESILERDQSVAHDQEIREFISGQDIAVTGAGGSIGSELVRQLLTFAPRSVTMIDSNEFHMFKIQREINGSHPEILKAFCVANIVEEPRISQIFVEHSPKIVFHAAAYKHVPLMEENPFEAIQNNIVGTRNLLRACVTGGVNHFVFISTDKAVNSCSVMGHSKRVGELLLQAFVSESLKRGKPLTAAAVRFGNVINSNGSVLPLFKEQILSGGPLTVTHPDMKRYFMSIREAVRLVMAAGTIGRTGEVFLLDMGSPVKIVDVAKKMLTLYGRRDIEIVYSGVRPGERLFEELTGPGEETFSTTLAKVNRVTAPAVDRASVIKWVADIEQRLVSMSADQIRHELETYVKGASEVLVEPVPSALLSSR